MLNSLNWPHKFFDFLRDYILEELSSHNIPYNFLARVPPI